MVVTRFRLFVAVGLLVSGSTSFETRAQSQDDVAKQFVGAWRLVSWTQRRADGTTGQNPMSVGYLLYTDTSRMCAAIMNPNRPKWKSETAPAPEEAQSGITGFTGYCSGVEVHAKEGFVLHHVEIDKSPNIVGRTRKRWFRFDGPNRLTLRVDTPELTPPSVESILTWERVQK
jgi:hypothetical protein